MIEPLKDYQKRAISEVVAREKVGLFLGMGLGKTRVVLEAVSRLKDAGAVSGVLVVAPLHVAKNTWRQEAEKFSIPLSFSLCVGSEEERLDALSCPADVYVINREQVAWLFETCKIKNRFSMLVVDESTSFKSPSSKRFRVLKKNLKLFRRVVIMTGTPIANNLLDLWAQIFLLDRGQRLDTAVTRYREKYFTLYRTIHNVPIYKEPKPGAKEEILELIKDLVVTMRSEDFLTLSPLHEVDVFVGNPLQSIYKEMQKEFAVETENGFVTAANAAVLLGKLQQLANGFLYGATCHHEEKIAALESLLEGGEPLLVYYHYEEDKRRLQGLGGRLLDDSAIADWNAGKVPLLIAHPKSAGMGLNLQAGGRIVVWYSLPWSWELYSQGNARVFRTGQKQQVLVYRLMTRGTVDEIVAATLKHKKSVSDSLLETLARAVRSDS